MRVIGGARQSGKTTELVRCAADFNGYIVVRNVQAAQAVAATAERERIHINYPITFHELLEQPDKVRGRELSPLWVDDVDELVSYIAARCGASVGGMAITEGPR